MFGADDVTVGKSKLEALESAELWREPKAVMYCGTLCGRAPGAVVAGGWGRAARMLFWGEPGGSPGKW